MSGRLRRACAATLAGVAVGVTGCGASQGGVTSTDGDIVIGFITVTSGLAGDISGIATRGAQVAIADVNGRGGILGHRDLRLETCDNGSATGLTDPEKTVACATRFLREHLPAIAVTDEGSLSLVRNQLTANRVLTVGAYGGSDFDDPQHLPYTFSLVSSDEAGIGLTVAYIRSRGAHRVADMSDTSAPSTALSHVLDSHLRAAGIDVVDTESFGLADLDTSAQTSRVMAAHPDLVYINTYGLVAARVVRDFVDAHSPISLLGSGLLANTPVPLLLGVDDIPTLRLTTFTSATVAKGQAYPPALQHLVDGLAADGKGPLASGGTIFLAMYGYDIVSVYAHGFTAAGSTDPDAVKTALEHIHLTRSAGEVYTQDVQYAPGHHSPVCDPGSTDFAFGTVPDRNGVLTVADPPQASCS
jgi:branched-chain amino acid transport system substrate-binding protein